MNYDDLLLKACDAIDAKSPLAIKKQKEKLEREERKVRNRERLREAIGLAPGERLPPMEHTGTTVIVHGKVVHSARVTFWRTRPSCLQHPSFITNTFNTIDIALLYLPEGCILESWNADVDVDILSLNEYTIVNFSYSEPIK